MKKPQSPCKRDCTGRHIGCHAECDDYADYEYKKQLWYAYCQERSKYTNLPDAVLTEKHKKRLRKWQRRAK